MDIRCVLTFGNKQPTLDVMLGSVPHVGDKIKIREDMPSRVIVQQVCHVARGVDSAHPEPYMKLQVSYDIPKL
jgi:hypothetical protein